MKSINFTEQMKMLVNFISALVAFVLMPCYSAKAQAPSTIVMKNGSTVVGHIVLQRPGIDIMVKTEKAAFVVEEDKQPSIQAKNVKYENLSRQWKRWSLTKNALQGDANGRYLVMYDIKTKD